MPVGSFAYLPQNQCTLDHPHLPVHTSDWPLRLHEAYAMDRHSRGTQAIADVNADVENSLSGIRVAQSFVNESYELKRFDSSNSAFKKSRYQAFRAMAVYSSGLSFLTDLLNVAVLTCGALFMFSGRIDLADLTAYLMFIGYFLQPIRRLISFTQQYQQGMAGFRRFAELMDVQPSVTDLPGAVDLPPVRGDIELQNVSFQYNSDAEVLHNVSLKIPAGSTTAFVGPSGGGKTTLCHLIPRFYDVVEGSILIDGHDIRDVTLSRCGRDRLCAEDVFRLLGQSGKTSCMATLPLPKKRWWRRPKGPDP